MRSIDATFLTELVTPYRGARGMRQQAHITLIAMYLPAAMTRSAINTLLRQAHFLAQVCEESWGMSDLEEEGSGREYEGRKLLGNTHVGDGPRYKGRGLIQLTGRTNYGKVGKEINLNLIAAPALAATVNVAVDTACQFWTDRKLNRFADLDDLKSITRRVNGKPMRGLKERARYLAAAKRLLGSTEPNIDIIVPARTDIGGNPVYSV